MKKQLFLSIVLLRLIVFASSGCKDAFTPKTKEVIITENVLTGTKALDVKFMQSNPPNIVYAGDILNLGLEIKNIGASDIFNGQIYLTGYDTSYLNMIPTAATITGTSLSGLEGKKTSSLEGGYRIIEFQGTPRVPSGADYYKPTFSVTSCYEYQTMASPQICVDPHLNDVTRTTPATCTVKNIA